MKCHSNLTVSNMGAGLCWQTTQVLVYSSSLPCWAIGLDELFHVELSTDDHKQHTVSAGIPVLPCVIGSTHWDGNNSNSNNYRPKRNPANIWSPHCASSVPSPSALSVWTPGILTSTVAILFWVLFERWRDRWDRLATSVPEQRFDSRQSDFSSRESYSPV